MKSTTTDLRSLGNRSECVPMLRRTEKAARGFALIVALVMMGFLMLLVLSLNSMVQLDVTGASLEHKRRIAQQNAQVGLLTAMGQLQKQLGADQRVSARAEILDATKETLEITGVEHPYWTGVWDASGNLLTWLVSGNDGQDPLVLNALNTALTESERVILLQSGSLPANGDGVMAKKVAIEDSGELRGHYAYWVGDEGVKAKVNLKGGVAAPVGIENFDLLAPQQFGIRQVSGLDWFPSDNQNQLNVLIDSGSLDIMAAAHGASPALLRDRMHDLTLHSYGVLSDSRRGGLRKDLSVGLDPLSIKPDGQIFGPVSQRDDHSATTLSGSIDPGGPMWTQLRSWVNTLMTSGQLPVRKGTDDEVGFAPVIAAAEFYIVPTYDPADADSVSMHFMPALVLWNPYDVPLVSANYKVRMGRSVLTNNGNSIEYLVPGATILRFYLDFRDGAGALVRCTVNLSEISFTIDNVSLAPGEAKVYSMSGNVELAPATSASLDYHPASLPVLSEGYHAGGSYYIPVRKNSQIVSLVQKVTPTGSEPIREYSYNTVVPSRVVSLELVRTDGTEQIVSASSYLNMTVSASGVAPSGGDIEAYSVGGGAPLSDFIRSQGWGVRLARAWVNTVSAATHVQPSALRWLADHNPRALSSGPNPINYTINISDYDRYTANNPSFTMTLETQNTNQGLDAYVGLSNEGPIDKAILFEAPRGVKNLFSIGQLMHAPLYFYSDGTYTNDSEFYHGRISLSRFDNLIPAYAIGNSRAHVAIPTDQYYRNWADFVPKEQFFRFRGLLYDYSYLLNDALWDSYFFSALQNDGTDDEPLYTSRNSRMVAAQAGSPQPAADFDTSAENLMIDGVFNVNSVSVDAWHALLASAYGQSVTLQSGTDTDTDERAPLPRFTVPATGALSPSQSNAVNDPVAYAGYRNLTDAQLRSLAEEMVKQVKLRGPFVSLSQFVNRSLLAQDAAHGRHLRGAIAAAIESTDINDALERSSVASAVPSISGYVNEAAEGYRTEGIPGWLSQADVLAQIGSVLSARSDTFVIRSYGDYVNPVNNRVESRSWCEAVVQRLPVFVDPGQSADTQQASLNPINAEFGRRFVVVSFRWLSEEEL